MSSSRSFLPLLWRAGRCNKLIQVDSICNPSGSSDEGLHERSEIMLLGVSHPKGPHLVLSCILEVNADQRQSNIRATPGRRLLPLLHSTWDLVQSSHQRLEVVLECLPWPKCCVDARSCDLQSCEIVDDSSNTRFKLEHIHGDFIFHRRVDGIQVYLQSTSLLFKVLTELCEHKPRVKTAVRGRDHS